MDARYIETRHPFHLFHTPFQYEIRFRNLGLDMTLSLLKKTVAIMAPIRLAETSNDLVLFSARFRNTRDDTWQMASAWR